MAKARRGGGASPRPPHPPVPGPLPPFGREVAAVKIALPPSLRSEPAPPRRRTPRERSRNARAGGHPLSRRPRDPAPRPLRVTLPPPAVARPAPLPSLWRLDSELEAQVRGLAALRSPTPGVAGTPHFLSSTHRESLRENGGPLGTVRVMAPQMMPS